MLNIVSDASDRPRAWEQQILLTPRWRLSYTKSGCVYITSSYWQYANRVYTVGCMYTYMPTRLNVSVGLSGANLWTLRRTSYRGRKLLRTLLNIHSLNILLSCRWHTGICSVNFETVFTARRYAGVERWNLLRRVSVCASVRHKPALYHRL